MNAISTFTFHESFHIRIINLNGELWFVASDVASALDYPSAPQMTRNLDDDEKGMQNVHTLGGSQNLSIISESGLYSAILKSRKPEAKKFKKWVTSEVLPTIRKTGQYQVQQPAVPREYITQEEMQKIKRLVALCTHHVGGKDSFTKAIHYALRKATGVPSPNRFEVQHLPLIVAEFQRIFSIVEPYFHARAECQKLIIKHLIRDDAPQHLLQNLLDDLQSSVEVYNASKNKQVQSLFAPSYLGLLRN